MSLTGPDCDAVGMAPAPALGSSELTAEMAEVYAMAMLRDIPFSKFGDGAAADGAFSAPDDTDTIPATGITVEKVLEALNEIPLFKGTAAPDDTFASRRLRARMADPGEPIPSDFKFTGDNIFRGSGPDAKKGPFISQFMLIGNKDLNKIDIPLDGSASSDPKDGYITYGNQVIDQRVRVFRSGLDYMTNWNQWLDVQNGANMGDQRVFAPDRRFITTPRDLATYVRFDALYQAYLNACLIMLDQGVAFQPGFPDQGMTARTGFAAWGGPHVLSLVTEGRDPVPQIRAATEVQLSSSRASRENWWTVVRGEGRFGGKPWRADEPRPRHDLGGAGHAEWSRRHGGLDQRPQCFARGLWYRQSHVQERPKPRLVGREQPPPGDGFR